MRECRTGGNTQVKVSVRSDLASSFKAACIASNVSMAGEISKFMAEYTDSAAEMKPAPGYTTKRQRRAAIKLIIKKLEMLKAFEERCRDNIPENLQCSDIYENAEQSVSCYEEAIEILSTI